MSKGKEIGEYMEKHNIQVRQESSLKEEEQAKASAEAAKAEQATSGVLVQD